jgi:hypothetical protein
MGVASRCHRYGQDKDPSQISPHHPATFDPGAGVQRMRVVAMQMPPEPDEKSFYAQLLSSVEAPVRASMHLPGIPELGGQTPQSFPYLHGVRFNPCR